MFGDDSMKILVALLAFVLSAQGVGGKGGFGGKGGIGGGASTPNIATLAHTCTAAQATTSPWTCTITGVTAELPTYDPKYEVQARPTSIMKTITNLWTGNAANFQPLTYPS